MTEFLQQRIAEGAEFIARHQDSMDLEEQYAVEAARGTMADLERTLIFLHSIGSPQGFAASHLQQGAYRFFVCHFSEFTADIHALACA